LNSLGYTTLTALGNGAFQTGDWRKLMPERELLDHLIARKLPWLFSDLGFRVASFEYSRSALGTSVLILQSDAFWLRFCIERLRIFADVAPPSEPEKWWGIEWVCQAVSGELPVVELDGLGPMLRDHYSALGEGLGPKLAETTQALSHWPTKRAGHRAAGARGPSAPYPVPAGAQDAGSARTRGHPGRHHNLVDLF
jgi:hypothetical protein